METKYFFARVNQINDADRTIQAVASTGDIDRDGEIILPSAFIESLHAFRANPVILATHQHRLSTGSSPVIGSAVPESITVAENAVTFKMRFADTPLGSEYWQLYKDRHMRAFSIGFIPLEAEYQKLKGKSSPVFVHTKIELLEISAVPVPSNRNALARAKGFFEGEDVKELVTTALRESQEHVQRHLDGCFGDLAARLNEQFEDIKSLLITDPDRLAEELLLGSNSDPPDRSGAKLTEHINRIERTCKQGG